MNFSSFRTAETTTQTTQTGGILNLNKGGILDLNKARPTLKNIVVGARWVFKKKRYANSVDMDIAAFLRDANGKITYPSRQAVFFNQKAQQGIYIDKDDRSGAESEQEDDCERIYVTLDEIPDDIHSIVFTINIFDCMRLKQTFGMVDSAMIRLVDSDTDEELCRFELKQDAASATALIFAELFRSGDGWSFKAIGEPLVAESLDQIIIRYM